VYPYERVQPSTAELCEGSLVPSAVLGRELESSPDRRLRRPLRQRAEQVAPSISRLPAKRRPTACKRACSSPPSADWSSQSQRREMSSSRSAKLRPSRRAAVSRSILSSGDAISNATPEGGARCDSVSTHTSNSRSTFAFQGESPSGSERGVKRRTNRGNRVAQKPNLSKRRSDAVRSAATTCLVAKLFKSPGYSVRTSELEPLQVSRAVLLAYP